MEQGFPQATATVREGEGRTCPGCGRTRTSRLDIEAIIEWGECLMCDKIRAEAAAETDE